MIPIKIGAAALNQTPLDWQGNRERILAAVSQAKNEKLSLLCLPELCITGYGCEDMFHSPGLHQRAIDELKKIAASCTGLIVSVGLPVVHQNGVFNTACLIADGQIAGFTAKQFLAGDGIHYETRWFKPWPAGIKSEIKIDNQTYPIGDIYFDCEGIKIGFEICEDAWVGNRSGSRLSQFGVDVILNPSASHFAFGKHETRKRYTLEGSRAFNSTYVYCNLLGNEAGRIIYDGGCLIASAGKLLADGPLFSYHDFELTSAVVDVQLPRLNQMRISSFQPELRINDNRISVKTAPELSAEPISPALQNSGIAASKEEEFNRAVALGLFDYMRKSRSNGFVVSLSGGADSSATACLIHLMLERANCQLGFDKLKEKLGYLPEIAGCKSLKQLKKQILLTVYQATRNSSETTRTAAEKLAAAIDAEFYALDIDALVQGYKNMISASIGRNLTWERDDIALQNIQARVRAPGVWLLANIRGALLLSTSNRSEAAVGYATMDGDTSGGLSPIAGIDKNYLRQWLQWLEKSGPADLKPIPALKYVNAQQPTAELRPSGSKQTDEADLMPYEILDAIERAAIRDKRSPIAVFQRLQQKFVTQSDEQLQLWTERFFRLWARNQWKRERYAPSFHLDDENLDPKTWCRFPILSGGFAAELAELRDFVTKNDKNIRGK